MIAKNYGKAAHIQGLEIVQCDLKKHKKLVILSRTLVGFARNSAKGLTNSDRCDIISMMRGVRPRENIKL